MKHARLICWVLLATAAPAGLRAQDTRPAGEEREPAQQDGDRVPESEPDASIPDDTALNEMEFTDANGNPLPADVQEQLREHFRRNPEAAAAMASGDGPRDIVVRGRRQRGAVESDIAPERRLNQSDLRAYGAANIGDLLDALGSQISSNSGRTDGAPVVLLNGRRVGDFSQIARIPSEAIERMDIFPEEVALAYGFRADQKVVNIVTLERFDSPLVQLDYLTSTDGGWNNGRISTDYFRIRGDTRLGVGATYSRSSSLLESERDLLQLPSADNAGRFRTLLPENERISLNGAISRPVGSNISATASLGLQTEASDSLLGTSGTQVLGRDLDRTRVALGGGLDGILGQWLWTFNTTYSHSNTRIFTELAGPGGEAALADSIDTDFDTALLLAGPVVELPGGPLRASLRGSFRSTGLEASSSNSLGDRDTDISRQSGGFQANIDIPVIGNERNDSPIGRLAINGNLAVDDLSDAGTLVTYGYGLVWTPVERVSLVASHTHEQGAPTLLQLGGPVIETPNFRTFDFARQEVVDVTRLSGGNAGLLADDRHVTRLGITVTPLARTDLTFSMDYTATRIDNPIAPFPVVLPTVEAAFPERYSRDNEGRLTEIDARPVNFSRSERRELRWGANWSRPLGPALPNEPGTTGQTFSSAEEARRAFPNATVIAAEPGSALARRAENSRSRIYASLYHNWYLEDEVTLSPSSPTLDLLDGGTLGPEGGTRRHRLEFQTGFYKGGIGARLSANWQSGSDVKNVDATSADLRFDELATVNLNLFADLGQVFDGPASPEWLAGTRLTLSAVNIFNARPAVRDQSGETPLNYQPAYLDPLGRTMSITVRRVF